MTIVTYSDEDIESGCVSQNTDRNEHVEVERLRFVRSHLSARAVVKRNFIAGSCERESLTRDVGRVLTQSSLQASDDGVVLFSEREHARVWSQSLKPRVDELSVNCQWALEDVGLNVSAVNVLGQCLSDEFNVLSQAINISITTDNKIIISTPEKTLV